MADPRHDSGFRAWLRKYGSDWDPVDANGLSGGYRLYRAYQLGLKPDSAGHLPDYGPHNEPLKTYLDPNRVTKGIDNGTGYQVAPPSYTGPLTPSVIEEAHKYFYARTATRPGGPGGWDNIPAGKFAPAILPPKGYEIPTDPAIKWIHDHDAPTGKLATPRRALVHHVVPHDPYGEDELPLATVMAKVRQYVESLDLVGREGVVADGSWNPKEGTITVIPLDNFANFDDDGDQPSPIENVPLVTHAIGHQVGPLGGDRVTLYRTQSGYEAKLNHGPDDSPGAPAGEHVVTLRKHADGSTLATLKLTQDGAQVGDGAGGLNYSGGTLVKLITAGGLKLSLNDHTQQVVIGLPSGQDIIIDNSAGTISIGGPGLTQTNNGIVRQADLQSALANFKAAMVAAPITNASAIVVPTATSSATSLAK